MKENWKKYGKSEAEKRMMSEKKTRGGDIREKKIKIWKKKIGGGVYQICVLALPANVPYQPINI